MPSEAKWVISGVVGILLVYLGWRVYPVLVTLHILICFLLVIVVLLQSGKAADLAGAFGGAGSQTAFGPRGAATFLSKATTWCAIMFMVTSMTMVLRQSRLQGGSIGSIFERMGTKPVPAQKPPLPVVPGSQTPAPPAQTNPAQTTPTPAPEPAPAQPAPPPATQPAPAESAPPKQAPPAQTPPVKPIM
jgi:preprotein translocase subunit SecG